MSANSRLAIRCCANGNFELVVDGVIEFIVFSHRLAFELWLVLERTREKLKRGEQYRFAA